MNDKIMPEEKLNIINIVITSQTKQELKKSLEEYLEIKENTNNTEIIEPKEIIEQKDTPSIYSQKYRSLVEQDNKTHPRIKQKLGIEVPEDTNINSTAPSLGIKEELPKLEPKKLEKIVNNPWAESGARTVSPGELKLN